MFRFILALVAFFALSAAASACDGVQQFRRGFDGGDCYGDQQQILRLDDGYGYGGGRVLQVDDGYGYGRQQVVVVERQRRRSRFVAIDGGGYGGGRAAVVVERGRFRGRRSAVVVGY